MLIGKNENMDNFIGAVSLSSVFQVLQDKACNSSTASLSCGLWGFFEAAYSEIEKAWMRKD